MNESQFDIYDRKIFEMKELVTNTMLDFTGKFKAASNKIDMLDKLYTSKNKQYEIEQDKLDRLAAKIDACCGGLLWSTNSTSLQTRTSRC